MSRIDDEQFQAITRNIQIIIGALAFGVVTFWVVVTVVVPSAGGPKPAGGGAAGPPILGLPLLTAVSVLFGAGSVVASILIPKLIVDGAIGRMAKGIGADSSTKAAPPGAKQVDPEGEADKLMPVYQTQLIIASALNEGGAFLAGIAYMMARHAAAILVAGVLLALLLSRFPTADRIQAWLATQIERLAAKRRDDF